MLSLVPFNEVLIGLALLVAACSSILLTRVPGGIALFWSGSGVAAALLIRLPRIRWTYATIAVLSALSAANAIAAHRPTSIAVWFMLINAMEIALMVAAYRFVWRFPIPRITFGQAAHMTVVFGILIPGVMASAGGLFLHLQFGMSWLSATAQWWSSHTIGACLLGPPIILVSRDGIKRLLRSRFIVANVLTLTACLVGGYLTVRYVRFPFVSIGLMLLVAAFRMGGFGASLISLGLGMMITIMWSLGVRPLGLDPTFTVSGTLLGLPVIALLATVMPPIAVGLGSDARRAVARALQVSERRFRESMEHSPIGMLIADLDGVWTYSNIALQKMLGYTAEELRAMPPGGPSKDQDWHDSESRWKRLVAGEIDFYDATRCFRHKDGRWIWTHVAVSIMRDERGSPSQLIAQIESLEGRRLAEETLAAERERLKITLQSINDAVITADAATRITYINAAAEALLGLDASAVEGRRIDEVIYLMDPQTSKAAANLIGQSAHHGTVFRREQACLLHRPDGTLCYVTDVVSPFLDSTGVLNGFVIVFRDSTGEVDRSRELQHRALHDPLTGLSNRADFNERLKGAFSKAHFLERPAAIIAIDLDRFKAVNDAAGHAAGDAVLCKVADACRGIVRSSDTVARLGGDEFAVILENCAADAAQRIGEKILRALNPLNLEWAGVQYAVGASLGLAMYTSQMVDPGAWAAAADQACYAAKHDGRARLRMGTSEKSVELMKKQA